MIGDLSLSSLKTNLFVGHDIYVSLWFSSKEFVWMKTTFLFVLLWVIGYLSGFIYQQSKVKKCR